MLILKFTSLGMNSPLAHSPNEWSWAENRWKMQHSPFIYEQLVLSFISVVVGQSSGSID